MWVVEGVVKTFRPVFTWIFGFTVGCLPLARPVAAEGTPVKPGEANQAKARLGSGAVGSHSAESGVRLSPVELGDGSHLTVISPVRWDNLAKRISQALQFSHDRYAALFGPLPPLSSSVRLMDEETFYAATGAPRWTNALYYKNQIIIPLGKDSEIDVDNLERSVRHEYTHAVINALSGGRAPGWLDEGLAQWAEGTENPALQPALLRWLQVHPPVELVELQNGFTRLESEKVAAAYAQSLFAANTVINTFGMRRIRLFFDELRVGSDRELAFRKVFGLTPEGFEQQLAQALGSWRVAAETKVRREGGRL